MGDITQKLMKRIEFARGLIVSHIIATILGGNSKLNQVLDEIDTEVYISALQNGREQGYMYSVRRPKTDSFFTWCTYEHRNSDEIILNGREGYYSMGGQYPYKSDNKSDCIASFLYDEYDRAANALADEIISFLQEKKENELEANIRKYE